MITTINKDILTVDKGVICHFCNCLGAFGGLAGAIGRKWPSVKESYLKSIRDNENKTHNLLGTIDITRVDALPFYVVNAFTQYDFGPGRKTEYSAVKSALKSLRQHASGLDIYLPYKVGCGLGGGDWEIVLKIINEVFENYNKTVYICNNE